MSSTRGRGSPWRRLHRDEAGLLVGFIVKMVVAFALALLLIHEVGQVLVAQLHAEDAAGASAQAAAESFFAVGNTILAQQAAAKAARAESDDARVRSVQVNPDRSVTVTVVVTADTWLVHRIPQIRNLGVRRASEQKSHQP